MKRWVLVTGCDSGFGFDLINLLIEKKSFDGILPCYHSEKNLHVLGEREGIEIHPILLDIRKDDSVDRMVNTVASVITKRGGVLSGIVNNAGGLCSAGPLEWGNIRSDHDQMELNFFGQIRVTRGLLFLLRKAALISPTPRIVFTSSLMGRVAAPFGAVYAASKFALEGWCDGLRREMLPFGISVHLVEPGMFEGTKFYDQYELLVGKAIPEYGPQYREYCINRLYRLRKFFASKNSSISVAHALLHALTARWPKYRYRVGYDSVLVGWLFNWLPTVLTDLAITVCDAAILWDAKMVPIMPESSPFRSWPEMIRFAFSSYNQSWLIAPVLFILVLVVHSFI